MASDVRATIEEGTSDSSTGERSPQVRTRGPRGAEPKEQERERPNGRVQEAGTRVQVGTSHDEDSVSESKLYPVEEFMQTFVRQEAVMWQKGGLLSIAGDNLFYFSVSLLCASGCEGAGLGTESAVLTSDSTWSCLLKPLKAEGRVIESCFGLARKGLGADVVSCGGREIVPYEHTHTHTHAFTHTHTHMHSHTHTHTCIHTHKHTHMHTHAYAHSCTYSHTTVTGAFGADCF